MIGTAPICFGCGQGRFGEDQSPWRPALWSNALLIAVVTRLKATHLRPSPLFLVEHPNDARSSAECGGKVVASERGEARGDEEPWAGMKDGLKDHVGGSLGLGG
jgi:hypothetical protein